MVQGLKYPPNAVAKIDRTSPTIEVGLEPTIFATGKQRLAIRPSDHSNATKRWELRYYAIYSLILVSSDLCSSF